MKVKIIFSYLIFPFQHNKKSFKQKSVSKFKAILILNDNLYTGFSEYEIKTRLSNCFHKIWTFILENFIDPDIKITCSRHASVN